MSAPIHHLLWGLCGFVGFGVCVWFGLLAGCGVILRRLGKKARRATARFRFGDCPNLENNQNQCGETFSKELSSWFKSQLTRQPPNLARNKIF
ncbi:MAG: hypothetical protein NWE95_09610 [Candidatus Bathyarchaeota archaeon]|nr:hypothetical protein [Candidatus Bathyarchaeota archaeon]